MTEQFGFEQALAERATVDGHEWPAAAGTLRMQGTGNALLAAAGFTKNQNGGVAGRAARDLFSHCPRHAAVAREIGVTRARRAAF